MVGDGYGILAASSYVPRYRLRREAAVAANRWFAPALAAHARGHRSFGNWDEDAVSMAVEAARGCIDREALPERLVLASTSLPFRDRTHAGIVAGALNLSERVRTLDVTSSRRAATSCLAETLERPGARALVVASECLDPRPASPDELAVGHGAAAVVVGSGRPLARLLAAATRRVDLVDRYRETDAAGDYVLEDRWVRDEGHFGVLLTVLQDALHRAGVEAGDLAHLVLPLPDRAAAAVARRLGAEAACRPGMLDETIGYCGAAHPLVGLVHALARAEPGELLLVAGFGQGADALLLEAGAAADGRRAVPGARAGTTEETCYPRFLALRGRLELERGIRSERDDRTAHSVAYRRREALLGFVGARCTACDALQFPAARYCVACRAEAPMEATSLAELPGRVRSFTEDWLAATPRPPLIFGSVDFPGGASVVMEFSDFEPGTLSVGDPVRMAFRIKDLDRRRGFRRYFWKPVPGRAPDAAAEVHGG